jgi:hypothetical protein
MRAKGSAMKNKLKLAAVNASIAAVEIAGMPLFGGVMVLTVLGCRLEAVRERLGRRGRRTKARSCII